MTVSHKLTTILLQKPIGSWEDQINSPKKYARPSENTLGKKAFDLKLFFLSIAAGPNWRDAYDKIFFYSLRPNVSVFSIKFLC